MSKKKDLNILFIGNSHTYFKDMPMMVKRCADDEGGSDFAAKYIWETIRMNMVRKERIS